MKTIEDYQIQWNVGQKRGRILIHVEQDPQPPPIDVTSIAELASWATLLRGQSWSVDSNGGLSGK